MKLFGCISFRWWKRAKIPRSGETSSPAPGESRLSSPLNQPPQIIPSEVDVSQLIPNAQQPTKSRTSTPSLSHQEDGTANHGLRPPAIVLPDQDSDIPSARRDESISEGSVSPILSPSRTPSRNSDLSSPSRATSTVPLIHHNTSDLETLNSLRDQLLKAKVLIHTAGYIWIIPRCQLEEIITHQNVVSDISLNCPDLNSHQVHNYANIVVEKAKSLYVTLVLIKQSGCICRILDEQIFDADLPLTYCMPGKKRTNSFATTNGRFVTSLEPWPEESKEEFAGKQWSTLANVFELGKHYELQQNHRLPFIRLEEWEYIEKSGASGKVYSARIHPSHHEFKLNDSRALVAVKEFHSPDEKHFRKEFYILDLLGSRNPQCPHPHIIRLLATFKHGTRYHLIFPWAQFNLRTYWEENANPEFDEPTVTWALEQMAGIANALMLVHNFMPSLPGDSKGGVRSTDMEKLSAKKGEEIFGRHGDIKPENMLWFEPEALNKHTKGIVKLADFGLSRFHGKDSRSGLSPSGIIASPTYAPPECQLHLPVSRSYDIWSLGCVLLEFITWLVKGWRKNEDTGENEFSEFRSTENLYEINDDSFFTIKDRNKAIIQSEVFEWVRQLHEHERCSKLIHDLLDTVMTHLLVIDSSSRISAKNLNVKMQEYYNNARRNPDYMLKSSPYPAPDPPGLVTSHSSPATLPQAIDDQRTSDSRALEATENGLPSKVSRILDNSVIDNLFNQASLARRNGTWPPTGRSVRSTEV
ncbi:kinase domain-containing protein [Rutstroemia sp. NJR-2017a BBW]|nr:kinase domain-containing protein [Rutstroemia sp. NJR-2017a BBW]